MCRDRARWLHPRLQRRAACAFSMGERRVSRLRSGADTRIRTEDLLFTKQLLYR